MSFLRLPLLAVLVACCCAGCQGQLLSTALPGSNLVLSCPPGQEINIVATSASLVGSLRGLHASNQKADCLHPQFLSWSKSVCDNLQDCRLPKPDKAMFVCNRDEPNMISAIYQCQMKFPDKHTAIACDGQEAELQCEKGFIHTIKSNYGRLDSNTCTDKPSDMTFCTSGQFSVLVKETCDGKASCSIPVDPSRLPSASYCDDSPKYAHVSYVCKE